jgi:hypothetical protein
VISMYKETDAPAPEGDDESTTPAEPDDES